MSRPRFFIEPVAGQDPLVGAVLDLAPEASHHALRVLRLRAGDAIDLADGQGLDYLCQLELNAAGQAKARVLAVAPSPAEFGPELVLWQGLPKGNKMESIIPPAVELGVDVLRPVQCRRSVARLPEARAAARRLERWREIARASAQQSGRGRVPEVAEATTLARALAAVEGEDATQGPVLRLLAYEEERGLGIGALLARTELRSLARIDLLVGPEGGFSEEEVEAARRVGFLSVSLGPRILRTETCGPALLAMLLAQLLPPDGGDAAP